MKGESLGDQLRRRPQLWTFKPVRAERKILAKERNKSRGLFIRRRPQLAENESSRDAAHRHFEKKIKRKTEKKTAALRSDYSRLAQRNETDQIDFKKEAPNHLRNLP